MTTTHDGVTGRALVRALASLSASTALTVQVEGVEYRGEGLCSPYRSHQTVEVRIPADPRPCGVVLSNERFTVYAVQPQGVALHVPAPPAGHVWHLARIPAVAVIAAVERLAAITPGLAAAVRGQVVVTLPRRADDPPFYQRNTVLCSAMVALPVLLGFDDGGRPLFAEIPEPEAGPDTLTDLAGITEATFSPEDEPPAPADDDPEPEPEG